MEKERRYYYGALVYAFFIPFHQQVVTWALILWLLLSMISCKKETMHRDWLYALLPLLYFVYNIGFLTSNTYSFNFLSSKLSFIIFPLIFVLHKYSNEERRKMLKYFIYGLLFSGITCLIIALYKSIGFHEGSLFFRPNILEGKDFFESILYGGNYFFGKDFSVLHQTVYFAIYLLVGIAIVLFDNKMFTLRNRIVIISFFIFLLYLISNKAGFVSLILIFVLSAIKMDLDITRKAIILGSFFLLIVGIIMTNPRSKESIRKLANGGLVINKDAKYDFSTRLLSWDASLTLIMKKPILGYGTGDTQIKLNEVYIKKSYKEPLKNNFNSHNQFFQSWLENGILGISLLFIVFIILLKKGIDNNIYQGMILSVFCILICNALFESMFNRFSGVSFFSFIMCFIFSLPNQKTST